MSARKLLIVGGLALALTGMTYGLVYAVFIEHQTLDGLGRTLTDSFGKAARRDLPGVQSSIDAYARGAYVYVRQVDAHSHWTGLAMLLILLGAAFDRVAMAERWKLTLAVALLAGAVVFPLGVLMQTWMPGPLPQLLAAVGAAGVTAGMAGAAWGFSRAR